MPPDCIWNERFFTAIDSYYNINLQYQYLILSPLLFSCGVYVYRAYHVWGLTQLRFTGETQTLTWVRTLAMEVATVFWVGHEYVENIEPRI